MKKIIHEIIIIFAILLAMYLIANSGTLITQNSDDKSDNPNIQKESEVVKEDETNERLYTLKKAHREIKLYKLYIDHNLINSVSIRKGDKLIDLNLASQRELSELKGIGKVLAKRIIEYRNTNGIYYSPENLINVKGIGAKKLEAILDN